MRLILLIAVFISHGTVFCQEKSNPELEKYIESIRKSRMTEDAMSTIKMVSNIRMGYTNLTFIKDTSSGTYSNRYTSSFCPKPGMDSLEVKKVYDKIDADVNADFEIIRDLADFDNSGFITTNEANKFRTLIEFGLLADFVAKNGESKSSLGKSWIRGNFEKTIEDYKLLVIKATKIPGVKIPLWPFADK
jgi:hypothetical protein